MSKETTSRMLLSLVLIVTLASWAPFALADEPEAGGGKAPPPGQPIEDFIKSTKNPTDWLSWGADARLREVYAPNIITLSKEPKTNLWHFQRYRFRLWANVKPMKDVEVNTRLVFEPRHYCNPPDKPDWRYEEAIFDHLNVKLKNLLGLPLTVTLGRQDIIFGNGFLVLDGTPWDGSRTIFFDAVRMTYNLEDWKSVVDLIYVDQKSQADRHIEPFGDKEEPLVEQDERGVILYVTNKSLPKTQVDGYVIWKHDRAVCGGGGKFPPSWGNDADIITFGARVAGDITDRWKYRAEFAKQLGHKNGHDVCALGANSRLAYFLKDKLNNNFRVDYQYCSGDRPGTDTDEQFDRVWARWPEFSELIVYPYAREHRIAEVTNLHRVAAGWSCNPCPKTELCADYHLLFTDQNTFRDRPGFSQSGCFRGHLGSLLLKYKFNPHVSGHLLGELFCPGDYYDDSSNDMAAFLRYEIVFSW